MEAFENAWYGSVAAVLLSPYSTVLLLACLSPTGEREDGCAAGPVYCTATGVLGSTADTRAIR